MIYSVLKESVLVEMSLPTVVFLAMCSLTASTYQIVLNDILFSGDFEFLDLSYQFDNKTVYWPGGTNFGITKNTIEPQADGNRIVSKEFEAAEHGGTHIDAPYHFFRQGIFVNEIPLERLIVPLIIVDVSSQTNNNPDFLLTKQYLDKGVFNKCFGKPCVVIFKFGWRKYFYDVNKYLGLSNDNKTLSFPGLSGDLAEWITTSHKYIVGIGVDVASVDGGVSTEYPVHKITSRNGLYLLENVNLSNQVPECGCTAVALPMKIAFGTGGPLRLVAICPKSSKCRPPGRYRKRKSARRSRQGDPSDDSTTKDL